jgi:hypothetical protein
MIFASLSGDFAGHERSKTASATVKTAVLAPMPRASVRITTNENPGLLASFRRA